MLTNPTEIYTLPSKALLSNNIKFSTNIPQSDTVINFSTLCLIALLHISEKVAFHLFSLFSFFRAKVYVYEMSQLLALFMSFLNYLFT